MLFIGLKHEPVFPKEGQREESFAAWKTQTYKEQWVSSFLNVPILLYWQYKGLPNPISNIIYESKVRVLVGDLK